MAYGRFGWDEDKFFNSSASYLFKTIKGFNQLEDERDRREWERLRIMGTWVLKPYVKKGEILTPQKLLQFHWDRPNTRDEWLKKNEHLKPIWDKLESIK